MRSLITALLLGLSLTASAASSGDAATGHIRMLTDRFLGRLADAPQASANEVEAIVRKVVAPGIDMTTASRAVLGPLWGPASADERERFTQVFETMLIRTWTRAVARAGAPTVRYLNAREGDGGKFVRVRTMVTLASGQEVRLDYRVHPEGEEWKIVDVMVEGVSLVSTFRTDFRSRARGAGLAALITELEEKSVSG